MKRDLKNEIWFWLIIIVLYFGFAVSLSFLTKAWWAGLVVVGIGIAIMAGVLIYDSRHGT